MKNDEIKTFNLEPIFERFADTLEKQSQRTDKKLEKLTDSITELTHAHIEAKKDRECDTQRMERIEHIQDTQASTLRAMSDTVLILNERVNGSKAKWLMLGQAIVVIASAVVVGKLT